MAAVRSGSVSGALCVQLLLPGHLMMRFLKENLEANLAGMKASIMQDMGRNSEAVMLTVSLSHF